MVACAPELPRPLAVVCHDAGACNLILSWLTDESAAHCRAVMRGPAAALWRARFGERALVSNLEEALQGAALLLSGTGWASDLEHDARGAARTRGVRSVGVIDHWVNYAMRFERHGAVIWPDEFWVGDDDALDIAKRTFPGACIQRYDNLYLRNEAARVGPVPAGASNDVLYVLEPMRSDWGRGVAGEFQALDYFVAHRSALGIPPSATIRLRPHPSDAPGQYDDWIASHAAHGVVLDDAPTLAAAIARCGWVVGCESNALVVALAADRRVASTLPPWGPVCRLPQPGIVRLSALDPG